MKEILNQGSHSLDGPSEKPAFGPRPEEHSHVSSGGTLGNRKASTRRDLEWWIDLVYVKNRRAVCLEPGDKEEDEL